jgi:rubredoxin
MNGNAISSESTVIAPLGHLWDDGTVVKEPTESEEGEILYTCLRDETHTKTETIAKQTQEHTHVLEHDAGQAPTCGESGYMEYWWCRECGEVFADENGLESLGLQPDLTIPPTGEHQLQFDEGYEPDCLNGGVRPHWHCEVCGHDFADGDAGEDITGNTELDPDPTAHVLVPYENGKATFYCEICQRIFEEDENGNLIEYNP